MNFDAPNMALIGRLGLALALGLFVGIERGWREREDADGARTAGIRTYALLGLAGGVAAALVPALGPWPAALILSTLGAVFAVFSYRENAAGNRFSVTSVVAAFVVMLLGAYAVIGEGWVAASIGVAVVALLAARESLHGWLKRLTWEELRAGILLLAMTFVALPLLPDRTIDPWGAINPHQLWLMTISIAAISAVGYLAVRLAGPRRGLLFGAISGGLVSSTAVTQNLAVRAKGGGATELACAAAVASTVSLVRTFAIAAVVVPAATRPLALTLLPAAAVLAGSAALLWWWAGKSGEKGELRLENPVELKPVLLFAVILAAVRIASKLLIANYGALGFVAVGALTGLVDTDSVTLSAAPVVAGGALQAAVIGILIAVVVNVLSKTAIGFGFGGKAFGLPLALLSAIAIAALGLGGFLAAPL